VIIWKGFGNKQSRRNLGISQKGLRKTTCTAQDSQDLPSKSRVLHVPHPFCMGLSLDNVVPWVRCERLCERSVWATGAEHTLEVLEWGAEQLEGDVERLVSAAPVWLRVPSIQQRYFPCPQCPYDPYWP
jgi:hypothetical protein